MNTTYIVSILSVFGIIILVIFVLQIGSGAVEYQALPQTQTGRSAESNRSATQTYQCADDVTIVLNPTPSDASYTLVTPAGESVVVREQASVSGVRYENLDGNVIWHSSSDQVFLEELGVVTASECVRVPKQAVDPARATHNALVDTSWEWLGVEYSDGESISPVRPDTFILNFTTKTAMSALTDCNSVRGVYQIGEERSINFSDLSSTRMFCEDSQEDVFQAVLQAAVGWRRVDDQLLLILADGAGTSTFTVADVIMQ